MTPEKAQAKLNELTANVNAALAHYRDAKETARDPWKTVKEVVQPLAAYYAAVIYRQRTADPDEERRLTSELLQRIQEDGLALEPVDMHRPAAGFRVVDPRVAREVTVAEAAARRADQARKAFAAEHADMLRQHEDSQRMTRIKDALAGDDPAAFRDALAEIPAPATAPTALRSDDLAVAR